VCTQERRGENPCNILKNERIRYSLGVQRKKEKEGGNKKNRTTNAQIETWARSKEKIKGYERGRGEKLGDKRLTLEV